MGVVHGVSICDSSTVCIWEDSALAPDCTLLLFLVRHLRTFCDPELRAFGSLSWRMHCTLGWPEIAIFSAPWTSFLSPLLSTTSLAQKSSSFHISLNRSLLAVIAWCSCEHPWWAGRSQSFVVMVDLPYLSQMAQM